MRYSNGNIVIKRSQLKDILGWYGVIVILSAYLLLNASIVSTTNISYQLLNLTGSICIGILALKRKDYQPAFLNIVWVIITIIALIKIILK